MTKEKLVADHYAVEDIIGRIQTGLEKSGKSIGSVGIDDLSLVDEFHIGGRKASEHFFDQLGFTSEHHLLDLGCGIGGAARYISDRAGSKVTGIDLTPEFIEAGRILNSWVRMEESVDLNIGNALSTRYPSEKFDGAYTMHVFMNIEDKLSGFREAYRALKPGATFGVYDITKYGKGEFAYPVPWATDEKTSFLETSEKYLEDLETAGFEILFVNDRYEFAVEFFKEVRAKIADSGGPPPLGIHVHMGQDAPAKISNLTENLINGLVSPFEIAAIKR